MDVFQKPQDDMEITYDTHGHARDDDELIDYDIASDQDFDQQQNFEDLNMMDDASAQNLNFPNIDNKDDDIMFDEATFEDNSFTDKNDGIIPDQAFDQVDVNKEIDAEIVDAPQEEVVVRDVGLEDCQEQQNPTMISSVNINKDEDSIQSLAYAYDSNQFQAQGFTKQDGSQPHETHNSNHAEASNSQDVPNAASAPHPNQIDDTTHNPERTTSSQEDSLATQPHEQGDVKTKNEAPDHTASNDTRPREANESTQEFPAGDYESSEDQKKSAVARHVVREPTPPAAGEKPSKMMTNDASLERDSQELTKNTNDANIPPPTFDSYNRSYNNADDSAGNEENPSVPVPSTGQTLVNAAEDKIKLVRNDSTIRSYFEENQDYHENLWSHPVIVTYEGEQYDLFYQETTPKDRAFLEDRSLVYEPFGNLLRECRDVLAGGIHEDDELEVEVPEMGLVLSESSCYALPAKLIDILDTHWRLGNNDGASSISPLQITLRSRANFLCRLQRLRYAINENYGYSQLGEIIGEGDYDEEEVSGGDDSNDVDDTSNTENDGGVGHRSTGGPQDDGHGADDSKPQSEAAAQIVPDEIEAKEDHNVQSRKDLGAKAVSADSNDDDPTKGAERSRESTSTLRQEQVHADDATQTRQISNDTMNATNWKSANEPDPQPEQQESPQKLIKIPTDDVDEPHEPTDPAELARSAPNDGANFIDLTDDQATNQEAGHDSGEVSQDVVGRGTGEQEQEPSEGGVEGYEDEDEGYAEGDVTKSVAENDEDPEANHNEEFEEYEDAGDPEGDEGQGKDESEELYETAIEPAVAIAEDEGDLIDYAHEDVEAIRDPNEAPAPDDTAASSRESRKRSRSYGLDGNEDDDGNEPEASTSKRRRQS